MEKTVFNIVSFGAKGDGVTINTDALRAAAMACRDNGGGIILVPAGEFVTGIFQIFSSTALQVEKGGRLIASPILEDHQVGTASGGLLYAMDAHDIVLTGEGELDGNAQPFFTSDKIMPFGNDFLISETRQGKRGMTYGSGDVSHGPRLPLNRPGNMLVFGRCTNLLIENLRVVGGSYWTIHCADCEEVVVRNIDMQNDVTLPNNDGIHFTTCRNVLVEKCQFTCGDDCIAITGFKDAAGESQIALGLSGIVDVGENFEIRDCNLSSRSAGVRIGYGPNPVRNVVLRNLNIVDSNRGIGIFARQADVEDVTVENCLIRTSLFPGNWWGRGEPIQISSTRFSKNQEIYKVRNVVFKDIDACGENAITLYAEEEGAIDGVKMIRVKNVVKKGEHFDAWGGNLDLRPTADPKIGIRAGGTAPIWSIGVTHLELIDCQWLLDAGAGTVFSEMLFIVPVQPTLSPAL